MQSRTGTILKLCTLGWTALCGLAFIALLLIGSTPLPHETDGAKVGMACVGFGGAGLAIVAWFVGLVPLALLFVILGRKDPPAHRRAPAGPLPVRRRRR